MWPRTWKSHVSFRPQAAVQRRLRECPLITRCGPSAANVRFRPKAEIRLAAGMRQKRSLRAALIALKTSRSLTDG